MWAIPILKGNILSSFAAFMDLKVWLTLQQIEQRAFHILRDHRSSATLEGSTILLVVPKIYSPWVHLDKWHTFLPGDYVTMATVSPPLVWNVTRRRVAIGWVHWGTGWRKEPAADKMAMLQRTAQSYSLQQCIGLLFQTAYWPYVAS